MLISHYETDAVIGDGGMGKVYRATNLKNGGTFAVKVLRPELAASPDFCERFHREAKAGVQLVHPNIVRIFDNGVHEPGNPHYIVMDYLVGRSLADYIKIQKGGQLPISKAVDFAIQTTRALSAAHGMGITHRDLKPDNLFLVKDPDDSSREQIKVLDLGIAKLPSTLAGGGRPTSTGMQMGTPAYMSPEQCIDSKHLDHRSDIYSLGVILYEMLCGVTPFVAAIASFGEYVLLHHEEKPKSPREHNPAISDKLEEIVLKALAKLPEHRQQTAEEMRQQLRDEANRLRSQTKAAKTKVINPSIIIADAGRPALSKPLLENGGNRSFRRVAGVAGVAAGAAVIGAVVVVGLLLNHDSDLRAKSSSAREQKAVFPVPEPKTGNTVSQFDAGQAVTLRPAVNASIDANSAQVEATVQKGAEAGSGGPPQHEKASKETAGSQPPPRRFLVGADKLTVTDNKTGLVWQRDGSGSRPGCGYNLCTWDEAKAYCKALTLGGQSGWRLPTKAELQSIVDKRWQPTINPTAFPDTRGGPTWASSPWVGHSGYAWALFFNMGAPMPTGVDVDEGRVRCVR